MSNKIRNNAIWEWLQTCTTIGNMFFNFGDAKNDNTGIVTNVSESYIKKFINGDARKKCNFTVLQFKEISTLPNTKDNLDSLNDINEIMEWITTQNTIRNYPNFGDKCTIEKVENLQDAPNIAGQDLQGAKYMFAVSITYLERI